MIINVAALSPLVDQPAFLLLGGLLPDIPIMVLYLYHRLVKQTPDDIIWQVHYQSPVWLGLVHGAHSIPLSALGLALASMFGSSAGVAVFAGILLHAVCDLPVHAQDAHRHFLPFSQYRFISPFSYWDFRYHAPWVALFEVLLVLFSSVVVVARGVDPTALGAVVLVNLGYLIHYARTFLVNHSKSASSPQT